MTTPTHNQLLTAIEILSESGELLDETHTNASDLRKVIAWLEAKAEAQAQAEAETIALSQFAKEHGVPLSHVRKAWRAHRRNT